MEKEVKETQKDAGVKTYDIKRNGKKITLRMSYDVDKAFKDQEIDLKKAKEQLEDLGATCK